MTGINYNYNFQNKKYCRSEEERMSSMMDHKARMYFEHAINTPWRYDSYKIDRRSYSVQNEAKKRIDAALGLLKLKKSANY